MNKTTIIAEPGKQELFITREFEAPRELVFRAFSEPDLIAQWLGPRELQNHIEKHDFRTHGSWRYLSAGPDGRQYGFNGVIHEVAAPERVVRTFEFEGLPERGHVSLEILTLEELPGDRTRIQVQSIFRSVADRDGMVMSGMERGVNDSYERLDEMFAQQIIAS